MPIPVLLARCDRYDAGLLKTLAGELLSQLDALPRPGQTVLVKPNMISARNAGLSNTSLEVVRAVCEICLDCGARVRVGDSPSCGTAPAIARSSGLAQALRPLGVRVVSLGRPRPLALASGRTIGLSADAAEAELLLNLPRLKAHCQVGVTAAVKNHFGCVVGFRKAWAHTAYGHCPRTFAAMLVEVAAALPRSVSLLDGVRAMHGTGPTGGQPYDLGLLAAARDAHALDTAMYAVVNASPATTPVWDAALRRGLPGAKADNLVYPRLSPQDFPAPGFVLPGQLMSLSFDPLRLAKGRLRSLCARFWNP